MMNQPASKGKNASTAFLPSPQAANGESQVVKLFTTAWSKKYPNQEQLKALIELEKQYPVDTIKEYITWARINNFTFGRAIISAPAALKKWRNKKPTNGREAQRRYLPWGNGRLAPAVMTEEEIRENYAHWGSLGKEPEEATGE
jgi:hypothetical protein